MRVFLKLRLLLFITPLSLSAYGETLYVRPSADCPTSGDGGAYTCSASPGGVGAWSKWSAVVEDATSGNSGQFGPGDTLKACGTFVPADKDGGANIGYLDKDGAYGSAKTVDGDCSSDGGSSTATIDCQDDATATRGFILVDNNYVTIKNLAVNNCRSKGILGYNTGTVTQARNLVFENITFLDIRDGTATPFALDLRGTDILVKNVTATNIGRSCFFSNGDRNTYQDTSCYYPNVDTPESNTGDCWTFSTNYNGSKIIGTSYCDHSNADSKQGVLASLAAKATNFIVDGSLTILLPVGATTANAVYVDSYVGGTTLITGVTTSGGNQGIQANGDGQIFVAGNLVKSATSTGIRLGSGVVNASITNNTILSSGYGIQSSANNAGINIRNNAIKGSTTACIDTNGSSTKQSYNGLYSCGTNNVAESGSQAANGTGAVTADPLIDSSGVTQSGSPLFDAGIQVYPSKSVNGDCLGTPDIGATCDGVVIPYGYTLRSSKRRN